jgi:drug/metabolite transporter (DMT)-like permease
VYRRRRTDPSAVHWLHVSPLDLRTSVTAGLFGGLGYGLFAYSGFVYAPAAHGSVLLPGLLPLLTALFSVWLLGAQLGPGRIAGLALIMAGGLLVGGPSLRQAFDGGEVWKGDLLFVAASSCWSIYTVLCRKYRLDAVEATIAVIVFATVAFVPVYALLVATGAIESRLATAPWSEVVFQAMWQGMASVVISGITFVKMVQTFGPMRSTMLTALVPGLSATAAVLWLGEPLGVNLVGGLLLVTIGIVVGVRAAVVQPPAPSRP